MHRLRLKFQPFGRVGPQLNNLEPIYTPVQGYVLKRVHPLYQKTYFSGAHVHPNNFEKAPLT